jgi:hypothetical protein
MYVAGGMGANILKILAMWSGVQVGLPWRERPLVANSLMYGAKAGYYFDSLKFQNPISALKPKYSIHAILSSKTLR